MVPGERIELPTNGLQNRCSTAELTRPTPHIVLRIDVRFTASPFVQGKEAREKAWAKIDEKLVEHAAAIPFDWDKQGMVEGRGVQGVGDLWDVGEWDYSWTSLK